VPFLLHLVTKLPIPKEMRLACQRTLLDRAYDKDISVARKLKDKDKVESLERNHGFEIDLHDEDDDSCLTKKLLTKARQLRIITFNNIVLYGSDIRCENCSD